MDVYYCSSCGKRVSDEDIGSGGASEIDGQLYCSECADAQVPEVTAEPVESAPAGPLHCSRCKALIPPEDIESSKALTSAGQNYCSKCISLYRPLLEGLIEKEYEEESARRPRRAPTKGARFQPQDRRAEARAPGYEYEKKGNPLIIVAIAACVVIVIIVLAVALSGSSKATSPTPIVEPPPRRGSEEPPPPIVQPRHDTPGFSEDPAVTQAIQAAEAYARTNPDAYDAIIARFEQISRVHSLSAAQASELQRAINDTRARRRHAAQKARDELLAKADALEKKGDYAGARAALQKYPQNLKAVDDCWDQVQARIDDLEKKVRGNDVGAEEPFDALMKEVEELKKLQKEEEAIAKLKEFMEKYSNSSLASLAGEVVEDLQQKIEARSGKEQGPAKEEEEEKEEEEKEEEKEEKPVDELAVVRASEPLFYADFTGENLSGNIDVKFKGCRYMFDSRLKGHMLWFPGPQAAATLEFPLSEKPKLALLRITHLLTSMGEGNHALLTLKVNGAAVLSSERRMEGELPPEEEFDVGDKLTKGNNKLTFVLTGGNLGWALRKVQLRAGYDGEGAAAEKAAADERVKRVEDRFAKWLDGYRKELDRKRKSHARKFQRDALRALKPGKKHDLFNGKDLKGWKVWSKGGQWTVENGELVGRNNSLDWGSNLTSDYREQESWQDYTWTIKCMFENSCESRFGQRVCYPKEKDGEPLVDVGLQVEQGNVPLNKVVEFKFVVEGSRMAAYLDGKEVARNDHVIPLFARGFVEIRLGPNATIHIKEAKLDLKR